MKTGSIEKYFTNLRFNDQEISLVDNGLKKFVNLTDLILTCNRLRALDFSNLPSTLKVLDLSGNLLNDFQVPPLTPRSPKIEHLGLALNWLRYFSAADSFASTLVSLDLSHNQIRDLVALRNELVKMKLLKNLVLYGNPIVVWLLFCLFCEKNLEYINYHLFLSFCLVIEAVLSIPCQSCFHSMISLLREMNESIT